MEPSWVGRRISVRRVVERRPDGSLKFGDVVGDLVGLDAQTAVIESRDGLVEVPVALVAAARLALPATADMLALEAVMTAGTRPVETEQLGGWRLRADHGFTRRANSVLPLGQPGMPVSEAIARAHDWYAERGLPLVIACPTEARRLLDADLGERGWAPGIEAHVMVARLDQVQLPSASERSPVTLGPVPDPGWLELYRGGEGATDVGLALLVRHDMVVFASVVDAGETIAIGRGVVDDGWLGVSAVEVAPTARRRGHATQMMAALWAWGEQQGAKRTYLQVEVENDAAIAMYRELGYWHHHDYRYRHEPEPPSQ